MRNAAIVFFIAALVAGVFESRADRRVLAAAAYAPAIANVPVVTTLQQQSETVQGDDVVIPVAGIRREQLRPMFNDARTGHVHHALDILAPRGTPVLAAVDGTVRKLFTSGPGGLTIYQTDPEQNNIYYYAHLDRYADALREGMQVHRGDVIGYVGTTGNAPPGTPHLHFAIMLLPPTKEWWKGDPIDPYPILMQHGRTIGSLLPQ
ncbi:MAG TPA: M23 family metallopeptidase [Thermoanaerobaculia bacterium]|nr:M23 family metallopeptidase [Thermoanaerobaculia bacterium]